METEVKELSLKDYEKIAYEAVSNISTLEKNDNYRLGYHIYYYLIGKISTIEEALNVAKPRSNINKDEIIKNIKENLKKLGIHKV